jgi:hypothetical protein
MPGEQQAEDTADPVIWRRQGAALVIRWRQMQPLQSGGARVGNL